MESFKVSRQYQDSREYKAVHVHRVVRRTPGRLYNTHDSYRNATLPVPRTPPSKTIPLTFRIHTHAKTYPQCRDLCGRIRRQSEVGAQRWGGAVSGSGRNKKRRCLACLQDQQGFRVS